MRDDELAGGGVVGASRVSNFQVGESLDRLVARQCPSKLGPTMIRCTIND